MFDEDMTSKEFVKQVAVEIYKDMLSAKDKKYLCEHDDPFEYHFSLGMAIRNSRVYPYLASHQFTDGEKHPDDISDAVIKKLIRMAKTAAKKKKAVKK